MILETESYALSGLRGVVIIRSLVWMSAFLKICLCVPTCAGVCTLNSMTHFPLLVNQKTYQNSTNGVVYHFMYRECRGQEIEIECWHFLEVV